MGWLLDAGPGAASGPEAAAGPGVAGGFRGASRPGVAARFNADTGPRWLAGAWRVPGRKVAAASEARVRKKTRKSMYWELAGDRLQTAKLLGEHPEGNQGEHPQLG